jgi:hypothetical protein
MSCDLPPASAAGRRRVTRASEWVTWEPCPRCGDRAAVGWGPRARPSRDAPDGPVEFDCPAGCPVDPRELLGEAVPRQAGSRLV